MLSNTKTWKLRQPSPLDRLKTPVLDGSTNSGGPFAFTSSTIQYSLKKATSTHYFISILGLSKRGKTQQFQMKLHINNSIRYIAQPSRRLSFCVCRRRKLAELERFDIIKPVSGPTSWVLPLASCCSSQAFQCHTHLLRHETS